jgi:ribonuclease D
LIQVFGNDQVILIDPRSTKINLKPFYENILENKAIVKVVHGPSEDIRLFHSLDCYPVSMFDTERAARLLNFRQTSLSALLQELFDIHITKDEQTSNWIKRPLTPSQIQYAARDVLHLLDLKEALEKKGHEKGIAQWIHEENRFWDAIRFSPTDTKLHNSQDERNLSPFQFHVFKSLLLLRESYAKELQAPPFHILSKDILYRLVRNADTFPTIAPMLKKTKGLHPIFKKSQICEAFDKAYVLARSEAINLQLSTSMNSYDTSFKEDDKYNEYVKLRGEISKVYGQHTAEFILPTSAIRSLLSNPRHFEDMGLNYRADLLKKLMCPPDVPLISGT